MNPKGRSVYPTPGDGGVLARHSSRIAFFPASHSLCKSPVTRKRPAPDNHYYVGL